MPRHLRVWIGLTAFTFLIAYDVRAQGFKFLEVKVVDSDGKPMADVQVQFNIDNTRFPMPTDADGKVGTNVPAGENSEVEVHVKHEGYTAMAIGWHGSEIPTTVTIPLSKGVAFGGIVHDEQGQPVEGVEVSGQMVFNKRYGFVHDGEVAPYLDGELGKTDKDGKWLCTMAPEGEAEIKVYFSHPDYMDQRYRKLGSWDELKRGQKIAVLEKGVRLTGQLLDPQGKPAVGVSLEAMQVVEGGYESWQTVTDEQGRFTTQPIRKGQATVSVENSQYAPLQKSVDVTSAVKPLLLKLDDGKPLQIRVVKQSGEPLAVANVQVMDWLFPRRSLDLNDNYTVDADGIWQWDHAPADAMTYKISAPGYREVKQQLSASDELQTVVLKPAIKIAGRVIDKTTRKPIEKFKLVGIATIDCGADKNCLIAFNSNESTTPGEYDFRAGLLCKEFFVSCSAEGYKNGKTPNIGPDEESLQWDFELEPTPGGP